MSTHKNKIALITASSGGIGFGIAKKLSFEGCKVIINGRNKKKLLKVQKLLKNSDIYCGDLSKEKEIQKLKIFIKRKYILS